MPTTEKKTRSFRLPPEVDEEYKRVAGLGDMSKTALINQIALNVLRKVERSEDLWRLLQSGKA